MKVKRLINTLNKLDKNKEVVLYLLKDYNLESLKLETILDVDDRIEITMENKWKYIENTTRTKLWKQVDIT